MTKMATIKVPSLKVTVPLAAAALPRDLVPMNGPAGEPTIDLVLEEGSLTVRAKISGKNYRKLLKQVAELGADNIAVALQGVLRSPLSPGGPFVLEGAGFQAVVKAPVRPNRAGSRPSRNEFFRLEAMKYKSELPNRRLAWIMQLHLVQLTRSAMLQDVDNLLGVVSLTRDLKARPLFIPLAVEYRRCAFYALFALALIPCVTWWVNGFRPPGEQADLRFLLGLHAILAFGVVSALHWRLRVNERGVSRRRLFAWHLYPWEEFASGRVREGIDTSTYLFPTRHFWDRKLNIGLVADDDRSAIKEMIRRILVRPP